MLNTCAWDLFLLIFKDLTSFHIFFYNIIFIFYLLLFKRQRKTMYFFFVKLHLFYSVIYSLTLSQLLYFRCISPLAAKLKEILDLHPVCLSVPQISFPYFFIHVWRYWIDICNTCIVLPWQVRDQVWFRWLCCRVMVLGFKNCMQEISFLHFLAHLAWRAKWAFPITWHPVSLTFTKTFSS